jgi:hypothetical protein
MRESHVPVGVAAQSAAIAAVAVAVKSACIDQKEERFPGCSSFFLSFCSLEELRRTIFYKSSEYFDFQYVAREK